LDVAAALAIQRREPRPVHYGLVSFAGVALRERREGLYMLTYILISPAVVIIHEHGRKALKGVYVPVAGLGGLLFYCRAVLAALVEGSDKAVEGRDVGGGIGHEGDRPV